MKAMRASLMLIGFLVFFLAPIYQTLNEHNHNVHGDGKRVWGKHSIFKPILGTKIKTYNWDIDFWDGRENWVHTGTYLNPPMWMRAIVGIDSKKSFHVSGTKEVASWWQAKAIILLRWIVKLLIPGVFFIPAILFPPKPN